jgi:hypothetical protein
LRGEVANRSQAILGKNTDFGDLGKRPFLGGFRFVGGKLDTVYFLIRPVSASQERISLAKSAGDLSSVANAISADWR